MYIQKTLLCLALIVSLLYAPVAHAEESPRFSAQISPELELLAGVLSQTTWINQRGPVGAGNEYYRDLKDFFTSYREHEAVKIAQELANLGFTYDAPIAFFAHLGSLPELELKYEYSDYVVRRARGRDRLERFRLALQNLAAESDFLTFFSSWQPSFDQWIAEAAMDGEMVVAWLEGFFGKEAEEFHLLLAPAMFPGGGYGAEVRTPEGGLISFQVVREGGQSTTRPVFPGGRDLEYLSLHEWGHSFVNPALEAHPQLAAKLRHLYKPVSREMKAQAYGNLTVFLNEQVLRAVTTIAAGELYGPEAYQNYLAFEESFHFYLTHDVINLIRYYQENRFLYPTFDDFAPVLLERMADLGDAPWWHSIEIYHVLSIVVLALAFWLRHTSSNKRQSSQ